MGEWLKTTTFPIGRALALSLLVYVVLVTTRPPGITVQNVLAGLVAFLALGLLVLLIARSVARRRS